MSKIVYSRIDTVRALESIKRMPGVFTPTGSRMYAQADYDSDWDFIVNPYVTWHGGDVMQELITQWSLGQSVVCTHHLANDTGYPVSEDGGSVVYLETYDTSGLMYYAQPKMINLIFVSQGEEYWAWLKTTVLMRTVIRPQEPKRINIKAERVTMFRAAMKTALSMHKHDKQTIEEECAELRAQLPW